mgnify:FL=1
MFNLGVNDLSEIDRYLAFYPQIFAEYPNASFYIMSVNPVGDACSGASNEEIRDFNAKLKESFPDQYLDNSVTQLTHCPHLPIFLMFPQH